MSPPVYERSVYTRVKFDHLSDALRTGKPLTIAHGSAWQAVNEWNSEARARGAATPVFISDAGGNNEAVAVGLLRSLRVSGRQTRAVVESLRALRAPLAVRTLRSSRTGKLLKSGHRRAYVPIATPESVLKRGLDGIAWSLEESRTPAAYLLTWDPRRADFSFEEVAEQLAAGGQWFERWSCRANVKVGDRLFIMKVGREPKGIVASGISTGVTGEGRHWDRERARRGERSRFVDLRFERVASVHAPFNPHTLNGRGVARFNWTPQGSGIRIPQPLVAALNEQWKLHHEFDAGYETMEEPASAWEGKRKVAIRSHRVRERGLRAAKIAQVLAGGRLLACEVPGCGFVFAHRYGKKAENYIHVHHLKPLGRLRVSTRIHLGDLALVCANCHAVIHLGGQCLALGDVIQR